MDYFYAVIAVLSGLGALLMGFKILSDNMEKLATVRLKALFNKTVKNKLIGVGIGAASTAIVQSSSAMTVMVVGFVNIGVMTLAQAAAIIMGANIGTTITAQIVALKVFNVVEVAMVFTLVGLLMNMISKKDKVKTLGFALAGLGLVFMGLTFMSDAMSIFQKSEAVTSAFSSVKNPFLLLLIGMLVTALIQSSSAVTSILITMVGMGITIGNGGNSVLFVILGTNIGTCVTALLSSIGASPNAKRASMIHLLFNLFGALLFFFVLLFWTGFMDMTFARWFEHPNTQIAMFHTFFNVVCTMLFLPFTNGFVKLATFLIKDKPTKAKTQTLLDERLLSTPPIAIAQISKELARVARIAMANLASAVEGFIQKDGTKKDGIYQRTQEIAEMNREIISYMVQVSMADLTYADERTLSSLHQVVGDVLRISELADNIGKYTQMCAESGLEFSEEVLEAVRRMYEKTNLLFERALRTFLEQNYALLGKVDEMEEEIDGIKKRLISDHIKRLNEGICQPASSSVFINLIGDLERAADHITFIAHSIDQGRI